MTQSCQKKLPRKHSSTNVVCKPKNFNNGNGNKPILKYRKQHPEENLKMWRPDTF